MSQSTALVAAQPAPIIAAAAPSMSPEQIEIIKRTIMDKASDMELAFFLEMCRHKRLDPFSGQIVATKRRSWNRDTRDWEFKWVYQTTIDGMRSIAEDSGEYEGCDAAQWCGPDGEWHEVWLKKEPPLAARVVAYRRGRKPAIGVANYDFFCQTFKPDKNETPRPTEIWQKGAPHMLAKCAEALALRKAFPRQLGAVYSRDEMQGAGVIDVEANYEAPPTPTTADVVASLPAPVAEAPPKPPATSVSQPSLPASGPVTSAGSSPPPAATPPASTRSDAGPPVAGGGSSPAPVADAPRALAQRILECKTEAALIALSEEVRALVAKLGDSPAAVDLTKIYSDHRKTLKRLAVPRGPDAKPAPAKSAPPARRDDEPPPPTDEDR